MRLRLLASLCLAVVACGSSYTDEDTTANAIAARHEARVLSLCADPDAGTCTPSAVQAHIDLAFCANAREIAAHGGVVIDAGVQCRP